MADDIENDDNLNPVDDADSSSDDDSIEDEEQQAEAGLWMEEMQACIIM